MILGFIGIYILFIVLIKKDESLKFLKYQVHTFFILFIALTTGRLASTIIE